MAASVHDPLAKSKTDGRRVHRASPARDRCEDVRPDRLGLVDEDRSLQDVRQLADICRATVAANQIDGLGREPGRGLAELAGVATDEVVGEQKHVIARSRSGGSSMQKTLRR